MDRYPPTHFNYNRHHQTRYLPQPQPLLSHHSHRLPPPGSRPRLHPPPLRNPQPYFPSMPHLPHQLSPHLGQLPPLPPPPPPPSYPTPLPGQQRRPYNPSQPQYAPPPPNYSKSSRTSYYHSHRLQVPGQRSVPELTRSYQEYRPPPPDLQRILPDDRIAISRPPQDFNREVVQRPLENKPVSPYQQVDCFSNDLEGKSRLRVDYNDGFRSHSIEEFVCGRLDDEKFHHQADFMSSDRDYTLQRNSDSDSIRYDHRCSVEYDDEISRDDAREENSRWVRDRISSRDVHSLALELEDIEIGYGGSTGDYVYADRVCKESSHKYNCTSKKQVQKKSALLRLQKPKPILKTRESESLQRHYSGFNSSRGRDQHEVSDYQVEVDKKEGSPVEFDVSFKSNSLVAKAIVSSSNSVVSGPPGTKKMQKVLASNDDSPKPQTKGSAEKLDNSLHVVNRGSTSGKDTQIDKTVTGSDKASPLIVERKKKIVKKIVRKVENSNLNGLGSQPSKKPSLEVKADGSKLSPFTVSSYEKNHKPSEEENATLNEVPSHPNADPTPEKTSGSDSSLQLLENDAGTISSEALRSKNFGFGSNAGEEKGNHETATAFLNPGNSALNFNGLLDTEKVLSKSLTGSFIDNIGKLEGTSEESTPKEISISLLDTGVNEKMGTVDNSNLLLSSSVDVKCKKELLKSWENEKIGGAEEIASTLHTYENIGYSHSGKTRFQDGPTYTESRQHDHATSMNSDNPSSQCSIPVHSRSVEDGSAERLYPSVDTQFPLQCSKEKSSNGVSSIKYDVGDVDIVKRNNAWTLLNTEHEPVKTVDIDNHTFDIHGILNSSDKDPTKVDSDLYLENLVTSSGIIMDSVNFAKGKSLLDGCSEEKLPFTVNADHDQKDIPPLFHKKRKFSATPDGTPAESDPCYKTAFISHHDKLCIRPGNDTMQQMMKVVSSSQDTIPPTFLRQCLEGSDFFPKNRFIEAFDNEGLNFQNHDVTHLSMHEESFIPKLQSACLTVLEKEGTEIISSNFSLSDSQDNAIVENRLQEEVDTDRHLVDKIPFHSEITECKVFVDCEPQDYGIKSTRVDPLSTFHATDVHCCSQPKNRSLPAYSGQVSTTNSSGELVESVPDALPSYLDTAIQVPCWNISYSNASLSLISNGKDDGRDNNLNVKPISEDGLKSVSDRSSDQCSEMNTSAGHAGESEKSFFGKIASPQSQNLTKNSVEHLMSVKSNLKSNKPSHVIPASSSFLSSVSKKTRPAKPIAKPRTWHRSVHSAAGIPSSKRQCIDNHGNSHNISYVRKGNSLVRKPVPFSNQSHNLSVEPKNSSDLNESQKTVKHKIGAGGDNQPTPFEKPGAVTAPIGDLLLNHTVDTAAGLDDGTFHTWSTMTSANGICSPSDFPLSNGGCGSSLDPSKVRATNDVPTYSLEEMKASEVTVNQTGPFNNVESLNEVNNQDLSALASRRIVYVKRKANQLVATARSCGPSVSNGSEVQTAPADCYYKMRKNQLIRSSLEGQVNQKVWMPEEILKSDRQRSSKIIGSKKRPLKAATRMCRPLRASLVWTLHGTRPSEKAIDSFHHLKVLPKPFPWKRTINWRSRTHKLPWGSKSSSFSTISRKLLFLRKMDTVYTRSKNGFSLRKSKVLGIAGSSLKWSKSIEKQSKKANEEATRAVAAVDKKKRGQKEAASFSLGTERADGSTGERVFRIGLSRYKMDSSRQTLQKISDDNHACFRPLFSDKDAKRSYTPRRLVIGNNEYVQIGNGNQLIRNPKRRTRMLANEKVRWSLHTARMRLAKKRQYCQFFTRFGKCNKDNGQCPYIHDPSKVAVCTKFLSGLCCNPSCKLTHKVIPERMPDCSYFLQGLCTNRNCPYRHVNVSPKASICEAFLKGYCADGNECRKKHSCVCPAFQETGNCLHPESCKLYHPKSQDKGKKRKRSEGQKNARGRYFGSMGIYASEPGLKLAPKQNEQNTADCSCEGKLADFISLVDDSDVEVGDSFRISKQPTSCESIGLSFDDLDDLDELIKPVLIMKEISTA